MILRCEPTAGGRWTCRAGWDLRLAVDGHTAEAAFARLCVVLALEPIHFRATREGDCVRLEARPGDVGSEYVPIDWPEAAPAAPILRLLPRLLGRVLGRILPTAERRAA